MDELEEYKENIRMHGMMCGQYGEALDSYASNKQLADIAMGVQAFNTICRSIAEGWGISSDYICKRLKNFINGKYVSCQKVGYKSKMYCMYNGDIVADTATMAIIDSNVSLNAPNYSICEIYCVGKCNIKVSGNGRIVFICYGNPKDIVISGIVSSMKRLNKRQ